MGERLDVLAVSTAVFTRADKFYLSVYIVVYVHICLSVYIFVCGNSPRSLY